MFQALRPNKFLKPVRSFYNIQDTRSENETKKEPATNIAMRLL